MPEILLATALLLGGSGAVAPLHNLAIELLGIILLVLIGWHGRSPIHGNAEKAAGIILLWISLIPLLHLLPLPASIWTNLPGRELADQINATLDLGNHWRPMTLNPEATWLAILYLIPAAAMFLSSLQLDNVARRRIGIVVVACAFCSLILAFLQEASGSFQLYDSTHNRYATGFFINRNHLADFLLIAMLLASAEVSRWQSISPLVRTLLTAGAIIAFSSAVIATMSRMGLLLMPVAIVGALSYLPLTRLRSKRSALLAVAFVGGVALLIGLSSGTQRTIDRFAGLTDSRFDYWPDVLYAIKQYFPWGSGVGTFDTVYRPIENLNLVQPGYINHAHNEYLQIALEAGLPGILILALFLLHFAYLSLRPLNQQTAPFRRAASLGILILLLHSAVDYPLRTVAMITLLGYLYALLYPARSRHCSNGDRSLNCHDEG